MICVFLDFFHDVDCAEIAKIYPTSLTYSVSNVIVAGFSLRCESNIYAATVSSKGSTLKFPTLKQRWTKDRPQSLVTNSVRLKQVADVVMDFRHQYGH